MSNFKKAAIITGATSGFGKIFAELIDKSFDKAVDEIWIIGRREEKLEQLAFSLSKNVRLFPVDLTDKNSINTIKESLEADRIAVRFLVNAAGFGINTDFEETTETEVHDMVTLNCTSLTMLIKVCLPYMTYNSRIVNFASVAAFMPQPGFAQYAATKSYVLSLSRALNPELNKNGIFVTAVCPGPAATEFFDIAVKDDNYPKYKKFFWADPEKVVKKAFKDAMKKKEISIYSPSMKCFFILTKLIPHKFLLKIAKYLNN
ncbi:MAG: SDR family NAD(P)-dependent oxidoreductase [Lachnospiraceae bacterium]